MSSSEKQSMPSTHLSSESDVFQNLIGLYLAGNVKTQEVKSRLSNNTTFIVNQQHISEKLNGRQSIFIANHPTCRPEFAIPAAELPPQVQAQNPYPNSDFVCPFVKHILLEKLLDGIDYRTLISPIGFDKAFEEFHCLGLPEKNGVEFAAKFLSDHPATSLLIQPEGGVKQLKQGSFRNGFIHVAQKAHVDSLVLVALSDRIVVGENRADVIGIIPIPSKQELPENKIPEWVDKQRQRISEYKKQNRF